jgi:hypothetical protein
VFLRKELLSHPARLQRIGLIGDVVALEDGPSAVTGDFHDNGFGNSGPAKIPNGGSAQIVKKKAWDTCGPQKFYPQL